MSFILIGQSYLNIIWYYLVLKVQDWYIDGFGIAGDELPGSPTALWH
jgi:hypothetical protein